MTSAEPSSQRIGEVILRQVDLMERMLKTLLDASLLERGRLRLAFSNVELQRVIESAVEECRPALESKGQRLIINMPDHPLGVPGDEPRLVEIVRNLLDNAVKFTPEAGSIQLTIAAVGTRAEIQIQDTGCGVTPALLPQLFHPGVVAASTAHAQSSLGLGLYITKQLVELHNGTINAYSDEPGQGSQFHVSLPLAEAAPPSY